MVSIDEVARAAGVSTATVSRALSGRGPVSDPTRARVEAAAKHLGYVVSASASSLASGRNRNIGVLVPFVNSWFFSTVLSGTATALQRRGYDITLYTLTADRAQRSEILETFLRRQRVDGVIAISIDLGVDETEWLLEVGLPVIAIGGPTPGLTTLVVDEVGVARLAVDHLVALGHRRHRPHRGEPRVRRRLPHRHAAAARVRAGADGCRHPPDGLALPAGRVHDRRRIPRCATTARAAGCATHGDLRGVRRDGDRRPPRRTGTRMPRPRGPLDRRHRRPRARRVLPADHGRPVPPPSGRASRGGDPRRARRARASHSSAQISPSSSSFADRPHLRPPDEEPERLGRLGPCPSTSKPSTPICTGIRSSPSRRPAPRVSSRSI